MNPSFPRGFLSRQAGIQSIKDESLCMNKEMTRGRLRGMVDPELLDELRTKPIRPMQMGKYLLHREASWKKTILDTVLPFCRHQLKMFKRYRHLLTGKEQEIVDEYAVNLADFEKDWRSMPFSYPKTPPGFENILRD